MPDSGANAIDVGLAGTDAVYFSGGFYNFDSGIEITASHAAARLSGMKIIGKKAEPFGKGFGMEVLKKCIAPMRKSRFLREKEK